MIRRAKKPMKVVDVSQENEKVSNKPISGEKDHLVNLKEYQVIQANIKELEKRKEEIKEKIDSFVDKNVKPDLKGNKFYKFVTDDGEEKYLKREARRSFSINQEKLRKLADNKELTKRIFKVKKVEYFDEDALNKLVKEDGLISVKELKGCTDVKESFATKIVKSLED